MTLPRTLIAGAVVAAALAPAPAAVARPVGSLAAVDTHTIDHLVCQIVVAVTGIQRYCEEND